MNPNTLPWTIPLDTDSSADLARPICTYCSLCEKKVAIQARVELSMPNKDNLWIKAYHVAQHHRPCGNRLRSYKKCHLDFRLITVLFSGNRTVISLP